LFPFKGMPGIDFSLVLRSSRLTTRSRVGEKWLRFHLSTIGRAEDPKEMVWSFVAFVQPLRDCEFR